MILLGSAAAIRNNCLPAWREGMAIADYDLVGTDDEFKALVAYFKGLGKHVLAHDRGVTHKAIRVADDYRTSERILIDWVTMAPESSRILDRLTDFDDGEVFGFPVRLASPLTQYVTKRAYGRFFDLEKIEKDVAHWRQMVADEGLTLTPDHVALFKAIRAEYAERLNKA
ncbi:hypothetical protein [Brevundimonas sp. NPDC058933]|uniref:hypothetical protein n=1 Tax=Brevundimonas sp. NPDC058933 TaxID=3346673 RepID=UPI003BEECAE4